MTDYSKLQNGSDIRGVALPTDGGKPVNLTHEAVTSIGFAFAEWTAKKLNLDKAALRIAIGRDSRLSGEQLTRWLADGIVMFGASAFDCGLASTPAMFMCCVDHPHYDAGIMVTASHLPMERNGMKFFLKTGGLEKSDISEILALAASHSMVNFPDAETELKEDDVMTPYISGLTNKILDALGATLDAKPLEGLHIIVDAGNGAGGFFAERLLLPLGANIDGSQYLNPDGRFPNHQPNPENADAMRSICDAVRKNNADLGIIFDTDVDRAGAVLPSENGVIPLDRNRLIALMSSILHEQYGSITVVTDSITSTGLSGFISRLDCKHHRFKRGYRNVINEAKRLMANGENAIFAMETSGHGALYENYFLDDGAYIIVKLLIALVQARRDGKALSDRIAELSEPIESAEARLGVSPDAPVGYADEVLAHVADYFSALDGFSIVSPNYEGVRVSADSAHGDGWFLIRRSLHDPIMPCNLESNASGGLKLLAAALHDCICGFDGLDMSPLTELLD